ncbi:uncharacterized protein MEPE_03936 [Melanopsichium pennsylvanicum]|uniref:Uncharacterized protein n=2 Tax=Melanopsichium pennsylvanicum TaxID=63383 RepID=A0AAJ4XNW9_9BASI|nr:conserved hypothetical protein [Melanopsichium pennsylvanicum 4]SNX85227.1 uncharacterized protein MEPE_03936 [Melanopsichium pennsylvanicum]
MEFDQSLPSVAYDQEAIYTTLTQFDETDPEFQAGIQTIIGPMQSSGVSSEQIEETKRRAKVFFWSQKTGNQVDYVDYKAWLESHSDSISDANGAATASIDGIDGKEEESDEEKEKDPYPASFDAIVELITTGKTDQIPGIRDIPLKINEEKPTQATMSRPLKPWERADVPTVDLPESSHETNASAGSIQMHTSSTA